MKKNLKRLGKEYPITLFIIVTTLAFSFLILSANYFHYPVNGAKDYIFIAFHWIASTLGIFCILSILNLNRFIFILFPILLTTSSVVAYFTWQYDISINSALVESILYTDANEVQNYLSVPLVLIIALSLITGIYTVYKRFRLRLKRKDFFVIIIIACVASLAFYSVNRLRFNTLMVRSPFSLYLASKQYFDEKEEIQANRFFLGDDATAKTDTITVIFVIGEALRADHIQLNGYYRTTMPMIEELGAISLPNVFSPYTHTAQSLMYILTRADSLNTLPMYEESSFIDIFKSSSFKTVWLGNQNPIKTFRFFINECEQVFINKPQLSDYSNTKKLDSDLIPHLEDFLGGSSAKKLALIHIAGNHWWYNKNYPDTFAIFHPILENKIISPSNRERMINSYDNATLFTDYVLSEFIVRMANENALLIFLADHGQSFGEEGKWLHANNTDAEKNPACFIWLSDKYKSRYPDRVKNLELNKDKFINTSFLFHSILEGSDISSPFIVPNLSVFSEVFQQEMVNTDLTRE